MSMPSPSGSQRPPRARWSVASAVYAVAVIAALVAANAIGARAHKTWDLTANHRYTLSASSAKVLHELTQPVQIYAFLQLGSSPGDDLKQLLGEYQTASNGKVKVQVIDPAAQPALARQYNVSEYNDVVVVAGKNSSRATPSDFYTYGPTGQPTFNGEAAITNAILRAANPQHLSVYFLQGDGEHATTGDYGTVGQALTSQGYTVNSLNLVQQASVPKDAAAVVIAGPQHDLAATAVQSLTAYMKAGGHLLVLLDPHVGGPLKNLTQLLASFGVTVQNDVVLDPSNNFRGDASVPVPTFQSQAITTPLIQGNLAVIMPATLSLAPDTANKAYTVSPLLTSSSKAYGHTDLTSKTLTFDAAKDIKGPVDLGVAVQAADPTKDKFRAVVFGSSLFPSDNFVSVQGNRDLFLNSVGWLTGQTEGITVRPSATLANQVFLSNNVMRGLFYSYVLLLPILSLVGATVVWSWRRRL